MKIGERMGKLLPHLPLLAAAFTFLVALSNFNSGIELVDEGVLNMGAWRISEGQVPYRDFFIPYTPFSFYYLAFFFKVLGVSLLTGRIAAVLLSFALTFTMLLLCRKMIKAPLFASLPILMMTQAGMTMWHFASHHWLGNLFSLTSLLLLLACAEKKGRRYPFLAGVSAAMAFISISDQGFYLLVFLFAAFYFFPEKEGRLVSAALYLAGAALVIVPSFAYLMIKAPAGELFYDLVVFPLTAYRGIEGNRMGIAYPFKEFIFVFSSGLWKNTPFFTITASATSLFLALLPFLAVLSAAYLFISRRCRGFVLALLSLGALSMIMTAARRWAPINLIWAAAIPSVLFWKALDEISAGKGKRAAMTARCLAATVAAVFIAFGIFKTATALDRYANIEVRSQAGVLRVAKPPLASSLNGLTSAVERLIPAEETFLSRNIALTNFLCMRMNPTRIDFFFPPVYSPEKQIEEVISTLESKRVNYVVGTYSPLDDANAFDRYIRDGFFPVWKNDAFVIYKRIAPKGSGDDGR